MVIVSYTPTADNILDCVEDAIRSLTESGLSPSYIICGMGSYNLLCDAIAARLKHGRKNVESFNHIPVLIDPFRTNEICVVPSPHDILGGVETVRV
ncbi:MAG: hypothetical protein HKN43_09195 [Rhodothermales bacterium]|nr:hypothetical protein [Rhodothermales bacterium]